MKHMAAGVFKAKCLKLMDQIAATGEPITVTKRGRAVIRVVPVVAENPAFIGRLAGTATFVGDIVSPIDEPWDATADAADAG
jgi:antitoxin (DNA-binding transcriptional repressor) of toxin-antitoxin stability system